MTATPFVTRLWYLPPGIDAMAEPAADSCERLSLVTPEVVRDAARALDDAAPVLGALGVRTIVGAIDAVAHAWQEPRNPYRLALLTHGPALTRYSEAALAYALDRMLPKFDADGLQAVLADELGDPAALDGFAPFGAGARRMARGLGRQLHVLAGSVPTVGIFSIICALLVKSPVLAKPSAHDPIFPALFAQALAEAEPRLAGALAVLPWPGGDEGIEHGALDGAGAVIAYGSDATIACLRRRAPETARFLGYGNKLSVAAIARECLRTDQAGETARRLAWDVSLFDQQGCLSPQMALVETGGERSPEEFGGLVAAELGRLSVELPPGTLTKPEAAAIQNLRMQVDFRAGLGTGTRIWHGGDRIDWTVVLVPEFDPAYAVKGRTAVLVPAEDLTAALPELCRRLPVSTVGLAASPQRAPVIAAAVAPFAGRISPLGTMGEPPVTWRHDGRPNLGDLVTWVDWETG